MTENPFREHLLATPQRMAADGWFDIPTGPGLGVEVDEKFVAKHAIDPTKAPSHTGYERPEGSGPEGSGGQTPGREGGSPGALSRREPGPATIGRARLPG